MMGNCTTTDLSLEASGDHLHFADPFIAKPQNICCIGAGYVGSPTSTVIAFKNPDINVHVVDLNESRIQAWNSNELPVTEPDLLPLVQITRDGTHERRPNLRFSTNITQAIKEADLVFIAVNTPLKISDRNAHQALDISCVEAAAKTIAQASTSDKIVVEKSTVPCGTSKSIQRTLTAMGKPGIRFDVISNPEFLAEGTAVSDLLNPDRILIGSQQHPRSVQAAKTLSYVYEGWIPKERILFINTRSAELTKLAANALLAQRVSSINALSAICETAGADIEEVALACGLDTRIGSRMLKASLGYGGSCLKKDVLTLACFADDLGCHQIGSYWRSVDEMNESQKSRFTERIVKRMNNSLVGTTFAVFGCAFKKDTGDIRESPGVSLIADLLAKGAQAAVYDPKVRPSQLLQALRKMPLLREAGEAWKCNLRICTSAYDACEDAHGVVIATDCDEFSNRMRSAESEAGSDMLSNGTQKRVNWCKIARGMRNPKLVFDGRNIVDTEQLTRFEMEVHMVGKRSAGLL